MDVLAEKSFDFRSKNTYKIRLDRLSNAALKIDNNASKCRVTHTSFDKFVALLTKNKKKTIARQNPV